MKTSIGLLGILILLFALIIQPTSAVTASNVLAPAETIINVNTTTDENSDPGTGCSLREAILSANLTTSSTVGGCIKTGTGPAMIQVPTGTYLLDLVGANEEAGLTGDLDILNSMTIEGNGRGNTFIDGNGTDRVFDVLAGSGATVGIRSMTIRNGNLPISGDGGAVRNNANLTLYNVDIRYNHASNGGGGIYHKSGSAPLSPFFDDGTASQAPAPVLAPAVLTLEGSTVTHNDANGDGGGIMNATGSSMIIEVSEISYNTSDIDLNGAGFGGGIYNYSSAPFQLSNSIVAFNSAGHGSGGGLMTSFTIPGDDVTITDTLFSGNQAHNSAGGNIYHSTGSMDLIRSTVEGGIATWGGGLVTVGATTLTRIENATFSGNQATGGVNQGGGIYVHTGSAEIVHSTIVNNIADIGAGIYHVGTSVSLKSNIIAKNRTAGDVLANCSFGTFTSLGYNLSDGSGCTLGSSDFINTDPKLGTYGVNSSPLAHLLTYALLSDSPAIDAADPLTYPALDQRGRWRPGDGNGDGIARSDIGSYEIQEMVFLPLVRK